MVAFHQLRHKAGEWEHRCKSGSPLDTFVALCPADLPVECQTAGTPALRSAVGEVGHRHMIRHTDQSARVQLWDQLWGMWDVHARVKAPEKEWDLHSSVHQQACDKRQSGDWLHQKEAERTKWNEQVPGQSPVGPTSQRWRRGFYFIHTYCCVLSHR